MKLKGQEIKYLMMLGFLLSVTLPVIGMAGISLAWGALAVALIGLVSGLFVKWDVSTAIAVIAISTFSGMVLPAVPQIGGVLASVFSNVGVYFGAMLLIPAFKKLAGKVGIKV